MPDMGSPWTTPADLREALHRRWERGRLLTDWALGRLPLPYSMSLRRPRRSELATRFTEVRAWVEALRAEASGYEIEWEDVRSRHVGPQQLPRRVHFTTVEQLFGFIGRGDEFHAFAAMHAATVERWPAAGAVVARRPEDVLAEREVWPKVMGVVERMVERPRPGCYLRELDIPGVDSKFIEARVSLLSELLDAVLPADVVREVPRRGRWFEQRYGFKCESPQVRLRMLDPSMTVGGFTDLTVLVEELIRTPIDVATIFVTENKVNGLAFPPVARAMVIFGLGYGVPALFPLEWLATKRLIYWGDIDTHGFAMLAQLRRRFPHVESLLMDEATLLACREGWVTEAEPELEAPEGLSVAERAVFAKLAENFWDARVRLEQERVPIERVRRYLEDAGLEVLATASGRRFIAPYPFNEPRYRQPLSPVANA